MARFIVTNSSYFKPFTYDELAKPIIQFTEATNQARENADTLAMQAGAIGSMIGPNSPVAQEMYKNYQNQLNAYYDELNTKGYNAGTARGLSSLRHTFGTDITKIQAAITKQAEDVKAYDTDIKNDKTLLTSTNPRLRSTDDYLNNLYAGQYKSYSGAMLTAQASELAANLKRDFMDRPDEWNKILGGQYFERDRFTGFHAKEVKDAIDGIMNGTVSKDSRVSFLQYAMKNVYDSSGIDAWADDHVKRQAYNYIGRGLSSGIGQNDNKQLENKDYMSAYLKVLAAKNGGTGKSKDPNIQPGIAKLRGNMLSVPGTRKERKDFEDKSNALESLKALNELRATDGLRMSDGSYSDATNAAVSDLLKTDYYKNVLIKERGLSPKYIMDNLNELYEELEDVVNRTVTNNSIYTFDTTDPAASNIAKNFKLNIGEIPSGKYGKSALSGTVSTSSKKDIEPQKFKDVLASEHLSIGFDARQGKITLQQYEGSGEHKGKYDDTIYYLNPKMALNGMSANVPYTDLLWALDETMPEDFDPADTEAVRNYLAQILAAGGKTVNLLKLADLISTKYQDMAVNGSDNDRKVYNRLIDAFGIGLYYATNTPYKPDDYSPGWGSTTGGTL